MMVLYSAASNILATTAPNTDMHCLLKLISMPEEEHLLAHERRLLEQGFFVVVSIFDDMFVLIDFVLFSEIKMSLICTELGCTGS